MKLEDYRNEIDRIDDEIKKLFVERMLVVREVSEFKKQHSLPSVNSGRESAMLDRLCADLDEDMTLYLRALYIAMFEISRNSQSKLLHSNSTLKNALMDARKNEPINRNATVACQGIVGANSQLAANRLFKDSNIVYCDDFSDVFAAVASGECQYGVLPIENNIAGSVTENYDLLRQTNLYIAHAIDQKLLYSLIGKKGAKLSDIKMAVSHPQALSQCKEFLSENSIRGEAYGNTAMASREVSKRDDISLAAVARRECAELYGLQIIADNICFQDNHTRFIVISKELEVYEGASRFSIRFNLHHSPGALYKMLAGLSIINANIIKIESRPISGSDFNCMFFMDIEGNLDNEPLVALLSELEQTMEDFKLLGLY